MPDTGATAPPPGPPGKPAARPAGEAISAPFAGSCVYLRNRHGDFPHRSGATRRLVDVAMRDGHVEVVLVAIALPQVLGDGDGAGPPPGAADRDHEVGLALGLVLGQQEVEQGVQADVELLEAPVACDVVADAPS